MSKNQFRRYEFDAQLVSKALKDKGFRDRFVQVPRGAYEEELRTLNPYQSIPEEVELKALEETESLFYVVLPYIPDEMHLSDEAIDQVARHERTHRNPCWVLGDAPQLTLQKVA